jgi:primary-amine oxidase
MFNLASTYCHLTGQQHHRLSGWNKLMQTLFMSLIKLIVISLLFLSGTAHVFAQQASCPDDSRISQQFDNGAVWELCWESRVRENLVLSDVTYTPPDGQPLKIISSARLSQLHVAYDDSDVTYNDVTQYGLGGGFLLSLDQKDCPDGELLEIQTRPALCKRLTTAESGYHTSTRSNKTQSLNLFSVSQVGAYTYILSWTFYANGAIEPSVGATGALQRSSENTELPYGRVLQNDATKLWLSHTHNYYWRLDFDLGERANDDIVSETRYELDEQGRRIQQVTIFSSEQALRINPEAQAKWTIRANAQPDSPAYVIDPIRSGHRYERSEVEPYSAYDFFITVANDCERFASQNARFNPDCLNNVLQYVDGQSIVNEDLVLWHRVSFHHVPRNEDLRHMHSHWDGFLMQPRNVLSSTNTFNNATNNAPVFDPIPARISDVNESIHDDLTATDPDNDNVLFVAKNLPTGITVNSQGHLHGETTTAGTFAVTVVAMDDHSETEQSFNWTVNSTEGKVQRGGAVDFSLLLISLFGLLTRRHFTLSGRDS